jgi:RNA polymerase sigma factor (sigma-70 family)
MTALATDSGRKTPARLASSAILACQSDERLVKLARSGHERAFEAIVERYRKPLVRYCARILPDSRCEDAVQQAFINAHASLLASDEHVQLKPWLYAITRNAALNMLRQNGWNYEQIPLDFDGVRRPDQVFEQRAELEQTVAAMNDLPERQRNALVMRELEGRSYAEIAVALGANDGAVRQLLNRARVTLRDTAALLMPPPLVARAAASLPPSDGRRIAELAGGLGAAGMAKAGATALVAGSLLVGAVNAPLPLGDTHKASREKATLLSAGPKTAPAVSGHDTPVAMHTTTPAAHSKAPAASPRHRSGSDNFRPNHRSESRHDSSGERERSGTKTPEHSAGSDDTTTRDHSGSSDDSTSSGSGGSDDHSSSGSGSDTVAATQLTSDDHSGSSGTSGSSGPSPDSGSGDVTSTDTSGSSGSGSDGSLSSGSGSSGGSDPLEH